MKNYTPDDTDYAVLALLQKNAKFTYSEIGKKLHKSKTAIQYRIQRLEQLGYIERYVALLNPDKLSGFMTTYLQVKLNDHSIGALEEFKEDIAEIPEITECAQTTGGIDFILKVITRNMQQYNHLLKQLIQLRNLGTIKSSFVIQQIKQSTEFPLQ